MPKQHDTRGFSTLVGRTIKSIDTSAINTVTITFEDGDSFNIHGDEHYNAIPMIVCEKSA